MNRLKNDLSESADFKKKFAEMVDDQKKEAADRERRYIEEMERRERRNMEEMEERERRHREDVEKSRYNAEAKRKETEEEESSCTIL